MIGNSAKGSVSGIVHTKPIKGVYLMFRCSIICK